MNNKCLDNLPNLYIIIIIAFAIIFLIYKISDNSKNKYKTPFEFEGFAPPGDDIGTISDQALNECTNWNNWSLSSQCLYDTIGR